MMSRYTAIRYHVSEEQNKYNNTRRRGDVPEKNTARLAKGTEKYNWISGLRGAITLASTGNCTNKNFPYLNPSNSGSR